MRLRVLLGLLAILVAGCVAEAFSGGGSRGKPCGHGDRRCINKAKLPAFLLFGGGPKSNVVASGNTVVADTGQSITFARGSTTTCQTSTGTNASLSSGAPCVEPQGLAVRPATSNLVKHSVTMGDCTLLHATATLAADVCPDGTANALLMQDDTTNNTHRLSCPVVNQGAGSYTLSVDAKPWTTNPDWYVLMQLGGAGPQQASFDLVNSSPVVVAGSPGGVSSTNTGFNITPVDGGYFHLEFTGVDSFSAGNANFFVQNNPSMGSAFPGDAGGVLFCNPQLTFTKDARPTFPNTGTTAATRSADLASVVNPVVGAVMSLGATVSIDNFRADNWTQRGLLQGGWDGGPTGGDHNTWSWFITDGGYEELDVYDNVGALKSLTSGFVVWPGRHYLQASVDGSGTMKLYQDATNLGGTVSGSGSGVLASQPSVMFIGSQGASANQFGGALEDVCADPTLTGCLAAARTTTPSSVTKKSLVALGDSLTFNSTTAPGWPSWFWPDMLGLDTGWTTYNAGFPAIDVLVMAQRYTDGGYWKAPPQYVSLETGINDVPVFGTDAQLQYWYDWVVTLMASSGSTPLILRESPAQNAVGWNVTKQGHYETFQAFVYANAVQKFGFPYVENFDGGLEDAGSFPGTLSCRWDIGQSIGGQPNLDVCAIGGNNWIHLNDAGQGFKEAEVRAVLGI